LADATPAVLASWDQALRATKAAASSAARVLRIGFISSAANEATQQIIAAFARRRPGWRVDMQQAAWSDATAGLASGDVDAALLRLPFPGQDNVRIEVLLTEPRWVALPTTHPLAAPSPARPSPAPAPARSASPGRLPTTPTPSCRTSSAAAWTISQRNPSTANLTTHGRIRPTQNWPICVCVPPRCQQKVGAPS